MWILTKNYHLYNVPENSLNKISKDNILQVDDNLFKLIKVFDFIYTKSEIKEDFGFVCEVTNEYFCVTFSKMNKQVKFRFTKDKKLRLIQELWKPTDENTYRKIWSKEKDNKGREWVQ